jgi:hypothetical protein
VGAAFAASLEILQEKGRKGGREGRLHPSPPSGHPESVDSPEFMFLWIYLFVIVVIVSLLIF